eukprot:Blabericola_migrator_1__1010@NODE_1254_length_4974_cov_113_661300_g647_i1_p6_GENE_NODE_1254_length_4974_cov_113_661300_g647_i1NODE_1254_length_4974_cov_113_661300_g647_i1_p6_ORF_typecomplete_len131_score11_85_NODE_1254_length_4974_cov_113_661300_g647_i137044096
MLKAHSSIIQPPKRAPKQERRNVLVRGADKHTCTPCDWLHTLSRSWIKRSKMVDQSNITTSLIAAEIEDYAQCQNILNQWEEQWRQWATKDKPARVVKRPNEVVPEPKAKRCNHGPAPAVPASKLVLTSH